MRPPFDKKILNMKSKTYNESIPKEAKPKMVLCSNKTRKPVTVYYKLRKKTFPPIPTLFTIIPLYMIHLPQTPNKASPNTTTWFIKP